MQREENFLVTIVTVSFNSSKTIETTLESVLNQSYRSIQYIIKDGGSTDGTVAILEKYVPKFKKVGIDFAYESSPDQGIYDAMNKGIQRANGSLVGILNSDDWYEQDTVSKVVDFHFKKPEVDIIYGIVREILDDQEFGFRFINDTYLHLETINHPGTFIKKESYSKLGLYSLDYKFVSDYDFFLRAKKNGLIFHPIYSVLCNFRLGGATAKVASQHERTRLLMNYGILRGKNLYSQLARDFLKKMFGG